MESLSAFATRAASTLFDDPAHLKTYVRQLEQELTQLREAVSPLGLVQFDGQTGRFISANDSFCSFVGFTEAELHERTLTDVAFPGDFDVQSVARSGAWPPVFRDTRFITKEGRTVWGSMASTFLRDPEGRLMATCVVKDISHRITALAKAAEANQFLSGVLEASTQGIINVDESGAITLVNLGAQQIFGYPREELIGQRVDVLLPESIRQAHAGHQRDYFREPRNRPMGQGSELTGRRKDGSEFPAEITLSHIAGEHGGIATVFVNDITERRAAQAAVDQARDRFTAILDASSQVSVIATEIDGTIRVFNSGAENMLGYRADEMIGHKTPLAFHLSSEIDARSKEILAEYGVAVVGFEAFAEPARRGSYDEREWTYVRKDGAYLTVNLAVTAVRDRQQKLTGFLGIATDVTDRKQHAEALRLSNERFRLVSRGINDGLWDWDLSTNTILHSERWLELIGHQSDELSSSPEERVSRLHPDDRDRALRAVRAHLDDRSPYDVEYRLRRKDGTYGWFRDRGQAVWDDAGKPVRMVGSISDVTERVQLTQQLEEALRKTDDKLGALVEGAPLAIMTVDPEGKVTTWNTAAETIFGYTADEAMGRVSPVSSTEGGGKFRNAFSGALEGKLERAEGWCQRKDGSAVAVSLSLAPLHDEKGEVNGVILMADDITTKAEADAELVFVRAALANAQEDEARRIARELHDDTTQRLALLSVDIGRTATAPEATNLAPTLRSYQDRLGDALEGIRLVSHRLHPSILDDLGLRDALDFLCSEVARTHTLEVDFRASTLPDPLPADVTSCLYRIAQESLRNIAKYARATNVAVRLAAESDVLTLAVIDSGVGFDVANTKSGLGLYSIRERASLVNGTVSIESEPGAGTRVIVKVPLARGQRMADRGQR